MNEDITAMNDEDDFEDREVVFEHRPPFKPSPTIHGEMEARWSEPDVFAKTGMRGLDTMLHGGLRRGECVALAGSAGHGKSSLAIQLALEAARSGGVAIYCTAEMAPDEILARATAREMFSLADQSGAGWAVSFGEVLRGHHLEHRSITSETVQTEVLQRYLTAKEVLHRDVYPRFIVRPLAGGATIADVAELVAEVRAWLSFEGLVVLVIDPLQRLFASPMGARAGKALEAVNANETERVSAVVGELKALADAQNLAAVFTSDTTKASASGVSVGDGLELRGSYQLAHLATVILTMRSDDDAQQLAKKTEGLAGALDEDTIRRSAPTWLRTRADAGKLGARYALLHCAKNRNGPPASFAMGFVRGAGVFVEGEESAPSTSPSKAKTKTAKTKAPTIAVQLSAMDSKRVADASIAALAKTEPVEESDAP